MSESINRELLAACEAAREALHLSLKDIGEWMQLARRQYAEMPRNAPLCPTLAGIGASDARKDRIGRALAQAATAIANAKSAEAGG